MSSGRDEGPVYYREIQKNAYLKRIPNENTSKLLPLGHKKPPLKPMWTLFCVHNGRTPYLEQYPGAESPSTLAHKPAWRACLRSARHVTASVRARGGTEYDFLVDTDHGPVRMLAPDWESMQDWVSTLRNKLHELKIVAKGENVYCAAPAPPQPRAAARDPTSPLPPPPPVPPDRVPGIEMTTPVRATQVTQPPQPAQPTQTATEEPPARPDEPTPQTSTETIDISNWEDETLPSTSQENKIEPKKSVTKICGQNICLDDSILKRRESRTDSDEEFFAEIDRLNDSVENIDFDDASVVDYKQRLVVSEKEATGSASSVAASQSDRPSNITVIQVSNKPPHTAIPVVGPETQIFNFNFKQNVPVTDTPANSFVNIVNTEVNVQNSENGYGTVFTKESDYGHISLTTTVSLTGQENVKTEDNEGIYERLCLASTSNENKTSPSLSKKFGKIKSCDKARKSSLPNLDISNTESTYEYLFPNNNNKNTMVTLNSESEVNSNVAVTSNQVNTSQNHSVISERNNTSLSNGTSRVTNSVVTGTVTNISDTRAVNVQVNNTVCANIDLSARVIRANVERSHSQNAYDRTPIRETIRTNLSPKREEKNDKTETPHPKPIWKRGLTELSLLSRLRGLGQRQESPDRRNNHSDRMASATTPVKVVHRSRQGGRSQDTARRRSSSLSNGQSGPPTTSQPALIPLLARQAAGLRAEQRRGAAVASSICVRAGRDLPVFVDYNRQVWVAWWGSAGVRCGGRAGDRVAALRGTTPKDAAHARQLLKTSPAPVVDILFHRVPLGKIYVLNKRDLESIGIKLDSECNMTSVEPGSPGARAGLPPPGNQWAVTEVNNRHINLVKGGEDEMNRISLHGTEVSILIQPSPLCLTLMTSSKYYVTAVKFVIHLSRKLCMLDS
ncbi:hypothetical protein NE865_08168 [Phthorimaea operculella]|nr:hypothetical protein NE865_08168 [Phthorimaea operculella]